MNILKKKTINRTFLKYFLSYLALLTVLIVGFFFVLRIQLTNRYLEQRSEQTAQQLKNIAEQLNDDLVFLSRVDSSFTTNINLINSRYKAETFYEYQTYQELKKYVASTKLINSIVYMPKSTGKVISTSLAVTYDQDVFFITAPNYKEITFDPSPYFGSRSGQLVFIADRDTPLLIYFPSLEKSSGYIFFYILDTSNLHQQMTSLSSAEMPALALIDADRQFVTGVNTPQLAPHVETLQLKNNIYKVDSSTSLCVHTGICNGFSMVAMISNRFLMQQINASFSSSYLILLLLSVAGFLVLLVAMKITFLPLHRLIQKIDPSSNPGQEYLEQLDCAFTEAENKNQLLQEKLENYRLSIQKALLDSIVVPQSSGKMADLPNIDQFFDTGYDKEIFAIYISSPGRTLPCVHIQEHFCEVLPGKDSCILLESNPHNAVFLINYTGNEQNKREVLFELLNNLHDEHDYLAAISNGSDSPLDIPSLYENVMHASSFHPQIPVVDFLTLPRQSVSLTYPHEKLDQLSRLLAAQNFSAARSLIEDLFQMLDRAIQSENNLPDFFVRCVLVDLLTVITNCLNQSNIKFKSYSELYFETLYFCRSCPYSEKAAEIASDIEKLIDFYEQKISDRSDNVTHIRQAKVPDPVQLKQFIENTFCQPDLSIAALADKFQISIAYASYLIKKEVGQNFSDYLWTLRLKKAEELLLDTDMSIDEISIAIGYLNTSSFRRKFKQETGMTPSQFRVNKNL